MRVGRHDDGRSGKDDDDRAPVSPFNDVKKSQVLRDANRNFNSRSLDARACQATLIRLIYMSMHDDREPFTRVEASNAFFATTKLFNSSNSRVRRLVYLALEALPTGPDEAMMTVNSLAKAATDRLSLHRANAIRALARVLNATIISGFDRLLRQALSDPNYHVVSCALIAGRQLLAGGAHCVRKWAQQARAVLHNPKTPASTQLHAIALLHDIRSGDPVAVARLVAAIARSPPNGTAPLCAYIRCIAGVLTRVDITASRGLADILVSFLAHETPAVALEAARSICFLPRADPRHVAVAVDTLRPMLRAPQPLMRFAAARALRRAVRRFPTAVCACARELEQLRHDNNLGVAVMAIVTTLGTKVEEVIFGDAKASRNEVGRNGILAKLPSEMDGISDGQRVAIVGAVQLLIPVFPKRFAHILGFVARCLRDEGGVVLKSAAVDAAMEIIQLSQHASDATLEVLCEFIEDCDAPGLSARVLDVLGKHGPRSTSASRYIRFVFNRVILEGPRVRAAAVDSLARFGRSSPLLRSRVCLLLERCCVDNDDEVRDRAVVALHLLRQSNGKGSAANDILVNDGKICATDLIRDLKKYLRDPIKMRTAAFRLERRHIVIGTPPTERTDAKQSNSSRDTKARLQQSTNGGGLPASRVNVTTRPCVLAHPSLSALGPVFVSSEETELTESDTEYVVTCVKHITRNHVIVEFRIQNHMHNQLVQDATVAVEPRNADTHDMSQSFTPVGAAVPAKSIRYGEMGTSYVVLARPKGAFDSGQIDCTLHFRGRGEDESPSSAVDDEYELEGFQIKAKDFMRASCLSAPQFNALWEKVGRARASHKAEKQVILGAVDLPSLVDMTKQRLGMGSCGAGEVSNSARKHVALLAGKFLMSNGKAAPVLSKACFSRDRARTTVTAKLIVRSPDRDAAKLVARLLL